MTSAPLLASLALLGLAHPAGKLPPTQGDGMELARLVVDGDPAARRTARTRLAEQGVAVAPEVLTFLGSRPSTSRVEPLRQLLADWPVEQVISAVVASEDAHGGLSGRIRTVRRLGVFGSADGLDELIDVASGLSMEHRQHPTVLRELEAALTDLLKADETAFIRLSRVTADVDPSLGTAVARAVSNVPRSGALDILVRMLGQAPALDQVVVECIGLIGAWDPDCSSGACGQTLSGYLGAPDPQTRRMAAVAMGRLHETSYLDELIQLLSDDDPRGRAGARWALQQISGHDWDGDPTRWSDWWDAERKWFRNRSGALGAEARGDSAGAAFAAIREISEHPVFAAELAGDLREALGHSDGGVASGACHALARLRGPAVFPPLLEALADERSDVRRAADIALRSLTNVAPRLSTPESWRELLHR